MRRLLRVDHRTRRELLLLSMGIMEISWLGLLLQTVASANGLRWLPAFPPWTPLPYLAVMLLAYVFYRWASRLGVPRRTLRRSTAAFLVGGVLLMLRLTLYAGYPPLDFRWLVAPLIAFTDLRNLLPAEMVIALGTLVLFARGFSMARGDVTSPAIGFRFRLCVLLLGAALVVAPPDLSTVPVVFTFFFVGLCAIALARTAEAGLESGRTGRFGPAWLVGVMGSAAIVLVLALGLTAVLTGENILRFLGILEPLVVVVGTALGIVVYLIGLIGLLLMPILQALLQAFEALRQAFGQMGPLGELPAQPAAGPGLSETTLRILSGAKGALTVVALVLVVGLILWVVNAVIGRRGESDEERETVFSARLIAQALRNLFKSGQDRLGAALEQARQFGLGGLFAAFTIRRIYAQMSLLAARRGHPRARAETPLEYRPALRRAFPGEDEQVERITQAYLGVRYGELPETPEDLDAVRQAWEHMRAAAGRPPPANR